MGRAVAGVAWIARPEVSNLSTQDLIRVTLAATPGGPLSRFVTAAAMPAYEYALAARDLPRALPATADASTSRCHTGGHAAGARGEALPALSVTRLRFAS